MAEPIDVDAPVLEVVLYEDRVAVRREVRLPEEPGRYELRVSGLTPLIGSHGLVCVPHGAIVEEARVERRAVAEHVADSEPTRALAERVRALAEHRRSLGAERSRLALVASQAAKTLDAAVDWLPRALAESDDPSSWVQAVRLLAAAWDEAHRQAADNERAFERAKAELAYWTAQRDAARQGRSVWRAQARIRVRVDAPGAGLELRYTVPCAVWRPLHRATLTEGAAASVSWEVGAMCWNATGEDWTGVRLACSTARPGDVASAPRLDDDLVHTVRRDREIAVEARDEAVELARPGGSRAATGVPGVDDGGEARTFVAPHPVDLPSSGRPILVPLEAWEAAAETAWIAHPERSAQVVLRSRQANAGSRPLLAGPVVLLRSSGVVGTGTVKLIAAGDPFELGWGSHDALRVTRRQDVQADAAALTGRQTRTVEVRTHVVNLGEAPVRVEVRERIPVSELEEVKVEVARAKPALDDGPDRDGFCTWSLAVRPGEPIALELDYAVRAPRRVSLPS